MEGKRPRNCPSAAQRCANRASGRSTGRVGRKIYQLRLYESNRIQNTYTVTSALHPFHPQSASSQHFVLRKQPYGTHGYWRPRPIPWLDPPLRHFCAAPNFGHLINPSGRQALTGIVIKTVHHRPHTYSQHRKPRHRSGIPPKILLFPQLVSPHETLTSPLHHCEKDPINRILLGLLTYIRRQSHPSAFPRLET